MFTSISFAQSDALFKKANNLYNAEDYEQAIATYDQLLTTNVHSAELYFNKANAHYKLNQLAASIFNYEKALQLNPADEDVLVNLAFANNQKIDIRVLSSGGTVANSSELFDIFKNIPLFNDDVPVSTRGNEITISLTLAETHTETP